MITFVVGDWIFIAFLVAVIIWQLATVRVRGKMGGVFYRENRPDFFWGTIGLEITAIVIFLIVLAYRYSNGRIH